MLLPLLLQLAALADDGATPPEGAPDPNKNGVGQWISLDTYQLARSLPSPALGLNRPFNPGLQASYHRALLGRGAIRGAALAGAGIAGFDQLFWELSVDGGAEAAWRSRGGIAASAALRLGYARAFTGDNSFELSGGVYRQADDPGRGFLRITPVDLALGYSPPALRRLGLAPAVTYAWSLDVPLYESEGATPWSYTRTGLSLSWTWGE